MHPYQLQLGRGGSKHFRKVFAGGPENFILMGGGGWVILLMGVILLGVGGWGSHNFEKLKLHNSSKKSILE